MNHFATQSVPDVTREQLQEQEARNLRLEVERLRAALAASRGTTCDPSAERTGPDPERTHPFAHCRTLVFLKSIVTRPNIDIGAYTYYSDEDEPEAFERRNVLFQTDDPHDKLTIGRFCSVAAGTKFFMNGSNHPTAGSTFPFWMFGNGWHERGEPRFKGPITIGSDVWLGLESCVLPGVTIGDGAIIGARAVVTGDVPPYAVMVGNPARIARLRYDDATISKLLAIRWWDWPVERITRNLPEIVRGQWDRLT
ncbi:MAG: CatB-related O-acetyltransferase [Phycisphaerae bacterium]|nr:CatB-related O-acetyltransferase [Phycisphaerae bacterium]